MPGIGPIPWQCRVVRRGQAPAPDVYNDRWLGVETAGTMMPEATQIYWRLPTHHTENRAQAGHAHGWFLGGIELPDGNEQ